MDKYGVYEELYEKIALLSDKEFADKVVKIVGAEYNVYDRFVMYNRMQNVIDLLAYGVSKNDVEKLIDTQTDDIAIKLIRDWSESKIKEIKEKFKWIDEVE